jgi:hypothetical protein
MLLPQREEVQKARIEIGDDSKMEKLQVEYAEKEIDSGSLKSLLEQPDQEFPAPISMAPSITAVNEEI